MAMPSKPHSSRRDLVDGGRQGGGEARIHAIDDIVAHQHKGGVRFDACLKGQQVGVFKGFHGPVIHGDAGVGVGVVSIAGEVLQHGHFSGVAHGQHRRVM